MNNNSDCSPEAVQIKVPRLGVPLPYRSEEVTSYPAKVDNNR